MTIDWPRPQHTLRLVYQRFEGSLRAESAVGSNGAVGRETLLDLGAVNLVSALLRYDPTLIVRIEPHDARVRDLCAAARRAGVAL